MAEFFYILFLFGYALFALMSILICIMYCYSVYFLKKTVDGGDPINLTVVAILFALFAWLILVFFIPLGEGVYDKRNFFLLIGGGFFVNLISAPMTLVIFRLYSRIKNSQR